MAFGSGRGMMDDGMGGMMMGPPQSPAAMSGGGGGGGGMHGMNHHKMMMHMTFFWGSRVEILFSGWPGDRGVGVYIVALVVVFVASLLVECLAYVPHRYSACSNSRPSFSKGLILTAIAAIRTGLSYMLMLAVMSFNVGVLVVAVLGHAVGFFVFGSNCVFKWSPDADGVMAGGQHAAILPAKC